MSRGYSEPNVPLEEQESLLRQGLKIVDISDLAESEAHDRAQQVIHESESIPEAGILGRLRTAKQRIWGELTKNYRRNKELQHIRHQIETNQNLYAGRGEGREFLNQLENSQTINAILERFDESHDQAEVLREGETLTVYRSQNAESKDDTKEEFRKCIITLIGDYATDPTMTDADFLVVKRILFKDYLKGKEKTSVSLYADNALEIAKAVRAGTIHLDRLKEIDQITLGRARSKVKTEAQYTMVDKAVDYLQRSPVTDKIPPSVIAGGVAVAFGLTKAAKGLATGLVRAVTFGFGGAVVTGATRAIVENQKLKSERAEVARSLARGETFGHEAARRIKLAEFAIEMRSANDFVQDFKIQFCDSQGELRADLSKEDLVKATDYLSELESRLEYANTHKVDTFSYGVEQGESAHTQLMLFRAQAKVQVRTRLGMSAEDFKDRLYTRGAEFIRNLNIEKDTKDKLEQTYRRKEVLRIGLKGATWGLVGGVAFQEITAFFNDHVDGLVEKGVAALRGADLFSNAPEIQHHDSTLAALFNWGDRSESWQEVVSGSVSKELSVLNPNHDSILSLADGGKLSMRLPSGFEVVQTSGGPTLQLPDHRVFALEVDPSTGGLTTQTIDHLRAAGLTVGNEQFDLESQISAHTEVKSISPEEYLRSQALQETGWYQRDQRPIWLGNDTPMYQDANGKWHGADFNELRVYLAGQAKTGFATDGSAELRIDAKELRLGSHGEQLAGSRHLDIVGKPAQAIAEKRLFWELTPVKGGPTFQVPFEYNADGTVTAKISPDSPIYQMCLHRGPGGKLLRDAYLSEVVEHPANGGRPLIYASNSHKPHLTDVVRTQTTPIEQMVANNSVDISQHIVTDVISPDSVIEHTVETPAPDVVPFLPLYNGSRRELEKVMFWGADYGYVASETRNPERRKLFEERRCKTLRENPNAALDHYLEIEEYFKSLPSEYVREVEQTSDQIKDPMGKDVKMAVCIPVAGHQEGKNIYQSLYNFKHQTIDSKKYEIVLFVNHPKNNRDGVQIGPDETLDEIERFKKDNPDVPIRVIYKVLSLENANIGYIRKLLNDSVLWRHHQRGSDVSDLVLVSNDADNKGVSPEYLKSLLKRFESQPETDGVLGQIEWDPEAYTKYPEVYVGTELFRYIEGVQRADGGSFPSSGANFSFKSSIYAGVGGYIPGESLCEDVTFGRMIVSARNGRHTLKYENRALIYTSARRAVDSFKKGRSAVEQWNAGFGAFDELRKEDFSRDQDLDYSDLSIQNKIKENLNWIVNQTLDQFEERERIGREARLYRRVIEALGIKYRIDEKGKVSIGDITSLIDRLKRMQKLAVLQRDMKSAQPGAREAYLDALTKHKKDVQTEVSSKRIETEKRFNNEISAFIANHPLKIAQSEPIFTTKAKLEKTKNQEHIGEFVIANDVVLHNKETGVIKAGYKEGTDDVYIVKESDLDSLDYFAEMPQGVSDPEGYVLSKNITSKHILLPEKRLVRDGKISRWYKAGAQDLESYVEKKGAANPKQAVEIVLQVVMGLKDLHEVGLAHTDITPSNLLITDTGVKIIDLDSAAIQSGKYFYRKGVRGNRFASAPELVRPGASGRIKFDKTVDVYAASATLYWLLAKQWPYMIPEIEKSDNYLMREGRKKEEIDNFKADRLEQYAVLHEQGNIEFPASIPESLQKVIKKGMSPYPKQRYQSIQEFGVALMDAYKTL